VEGYTTCESIALSVVLELTSPRWDGAPISPLLSRAACLLARLGSWGNQQSEDIMGQNSLVYKSEGIMEWKSHLLEFDMYLPYLP
jgi:hypothetical protein